MKDQCKQSASLSVLSGCRNRERSQEDLSLSSRGSLATDAVAQLISFPPSVHLHDLGGVVKAKLHCASRKALSIR